jgi:hypothetical protein
MLLGKKSLELNYHLHTIKKSIFRVHSYILIVFKILDLFSYHLIKENY